MTGQELQPEAKTQAQTTIHRLAGRRVVITGAASGIGQSTARLFASEGASVALFDRDAAGLDESVRQTGGHGFAVNITDEEQVAAAVGEAGAAMGGIDGIVNAAGIML